MAHRRAIYAARFLRPPSWTKRLLLREKPRDLTGPYENPVRRWVRLREKARQFSELPPPRRVPVPKPSARKPLQAVEGVPNVSPDVLARRLDFLLSPAAVEQQLAAPLRPGYTPYGVEVECWQRQMREVRRIYRAQYLQKLAEVTEVERGKEAELNASVIEERRRRKQAHLKSIGEDMKRRAILKDRLRIEGKVNEAINMARQSKLKRQKLYFLRRVENLSKLIFSAKNFDQALPPASGRDGAAAAGPLAAAGALLSRNVSVPFLLRQLGGAEGHPRQKSRRIPHVDNVQREILELSYDILPEDEPRFGPAEGSLEERGLGVRERARQLYGVFSKAEQLGLLRQKIEMLNSKKRIELEKDGSPSPITAKLLEELESVLLATEELETQQELKSKAFAARGTDPAGMPSYRPAGGAAGTGAAD